MSRGATRGAATAVLSLIVLQGVVSRGGSGRIASLMADVNGLVTRVFDPAVPAIPDHRKSASGDPTRPVLGDAPAPAPFNPVSIYEPF